MGVGVGVGVGASVGACFVDILVVVTIVTVHALLIVVLFSLCTVNSGQMKYTLRSVIGSIK